MGRGRRRRQAVIVAAGALITVACASDPAVVVSGVDSDDPSVTELDLFDQPVADAPDPAYRAGAAATYLECRHGIKDGGWSPDFGPPATSTDPAGALTAFITEGLFALPREEFVATGRDQDRRLFTYSAKDEVKVAVIVADSTEVPLGFDGGWVVETFASCDPAEFDPSADAHLPFEIWLDAEGNRVPTVDVTTSSGPEHCDWQSATFLRLDGRQYIGDPKGVLADFAFSGEFDDDAELPADAIDTGYRRDDRRLWLSSDRTTAFVVDGDRTEAWPSAEEIFGCA